MSQENVDLVRSIYANLGARRLQLLDWAHPEIDWTFAADGPSPSGGIGIAGMAQDWREYISPLEEFHHEVDEYVELDGGRVLVLQRLRGRGKTSGLDLGRMGSQEMQGAILFHVSGGKVTRLVGYFHSERALADLRPSEQDAHADS